MRGTPGNNQVDVLRALIALSGSGGGGGGAFSHNDFVYQPGGVAHANVFTDWASLITAVNGVFGMRRILIDTTFASATVPAGTWAVNNVQFYGKASSAGFLSFLTFLDGAHLTSNSFGVQDLILQSNSTTPVMTFAGGVGCDATFIDIALFSPNAPFFLMATDAGSVNLTAYGFTSLGDATNPILEVNGAATAFVSLFDTATLTSSATSGTGAIELSFFPVSSQTSGAGSEVIANANVQFPQMAGLIPINEMPQVPLTTNMTFLADLMAPYQILGIGSVQTANGNNADVPGTNLGDAAVPMPDHTAGHAEYWVIASVPSTDQTIMFHAEAAFKRRGGAITPGALLNVGGNALSFFGATAGDAAAFAGVTISMNATANGVVLNVTGVAPLVIDWTAKALYFYTHH